MPHFSLKQLILASTLVSIGIGLIAIDKQLGWGIDPARDALLWSVASMLIGAGVMAPFNRKQLGALLGPFVLALAIVIAIICFVAFSGEFHT
jgi:hypothetical protein